LLAGIALAIQTSCGEPEARIGEQETPLVRPIISASQRPANVTSAQVFAEQLKVVNEMSEEYGINPDVIWYPCGDENSYFLPLGYTIKLCAEMAEHPDAALAFAAHETGHAVTYHYLDTADEEHADELAALFLARHGYWDAMLGAAQYMIAQWPAEHIPGDSHPGGQFRAWMLMCAEVGAEGHKDPTRRNAQCEAFYDGLAVKWDTWIPRREVFKVELGDFSAPGKTGAPKPTK
jgi:hypothetical protein